MRILSASEAVAPAFKRTFAILFKPFRFGRSWKWGASAYVGQLGFCFMPMILILPFLQHSLPTLPKSALIGIWIGSAFMTALSLLFYYLGSRMQFVLLEMIATRATHVAPLWRKYGSRTWRWIGITIVPITIFFTLVGIPLSSLYIGIFKNMPQPGTLQPNPFAGFQQMMMFELITFLCMGVAILVASVLGDFVLPSIALEDASAGTALKRLRDLVAVEPLQVLAFLLLKLILFPIIMIAWYVSLVIVMLVSMIPAGIIALISWLIFRGMGAAGHVILLIEMIIGYIIFFVWFFYLEIGSIGILPLFMQTYGMYFLGGRYPKLGALLEPPPPVVVMPEPTPIIEPPLPEPSV